MELRADHERMVAQLAHLDEAAVWRCTARYETEALQRLSVGVVEFVSMAVALPDFVHPIGFLRLAAADEPAGVGAKAHRAALLIDAELLAEHADHRIRRLRVELCRIDRVRAEGSAGRFDDHHL